MNRESNRANNHTLTEREQRVLELVAADKRDKEIAEILGMSEHTVHNHWRHIYDKLRVHGRAAAVAWLLKKQHDPKRP